MFVFLQIHAEFTVHEASIATFWLATLNNSKRKQVRLLSLSLTHLSVAPDVSGFTETLPP